MPQFLSACERLVRRADNCEILLGAQPEQLVFEDGRVRGAEIATASGEHRRITARATLLATGGFRGDPELHERHIHPLARDLPLRANAYSTGDGLRLGSAVGAAFGKRDAGADAGGLWFRAYAGGAATALVFGLQAARTALAGALVTPAA